MLDNLRGLDPRALIRHAAAGLVDALGPPSVPPEPAIDVGDRSGIYLVRDGYTAREIPRPTANRRTHIHHDLADFAAQILRLKAAETADIYVEPVSLEQTQTGARAILRPGDPDSDILVYDPAHHARWRHWRDALGRSMSPADLREVVLIGEADTSLLRIAGQLTEERMGRLIASRLRKVKISANSEVEVEIDDLGKVVARSGADGAKVSAEIPATFDIELPTIQDLDIQTRITIRVSAKVDGRSLLYKLTSPGLSQHEHEMRVAIRDRLRTLLPGATVSLGQSRTTEYRVPFRDAPHEPIVMVWGKPAPAEPVSETPAVEAP